MWQWIKAIWIQISPWVIRAGKTAIGVAAEYLMQEAIKLVKEVDGEYQDNFLKWNAVFSELKERYPDAKDAAINLAIEMAVAVYKEEVERA